MALDLSTLKTRIASEIHRSDLTSSIADAITSAIDFYKSKRFEVNEKTDSFNTVANQQSYTSGDTGFPTDIGQVDLVQVTASGTITTLDPISFQELKDKTTITTLTGVPSEYAWYAQKLYLYPIPDAAYSISLSHQQRKTAPANDADSSTIWTNQCEALIRHCAKKMLYRDVLRDPDGKVMAEEAEAMELARLLGESFQLQNDGSPIRGAW